MTRNSAHDGRPNAELSNERGGVNSRTAIASLGIAGGAGLIAGTLYLSGLNPWFWIRFPLATLVLAMGIVVALVLVVRDVIVRRRRRHMEQSVGRMREEEREQRRRFLRRLDHEMKNPVTAIRTALATMPSEDEAYKIANTQAARLSRLVTELAKLADLETRVLDLRPVDLEELADEAVEVVASTYPERRITVEFPRVPWPIPAVWGDPDLLLVALYNVVANAAKYSDPGAHIEIRAAENEGWVTLEISDTGWGIAADELAGVWDELARGTNTRGAEGSGLGLSIVRVVAERHGGIAFIRSELGQGTRVVLRLRVAG
ncbi:MAG: HAMP domain-containing sensor histidine kinase [Ancrocorticia sp.]